MLPPPAPSLHPCLWALVPTAARGSFSSLSTSSTSPAGKVLPVCSQNTVLAPRTALGTHHSASEHLEGLSWQIYFLPQATFKTPQRWSIPLWTYHSPDM